MIPEIAESCAALLGELRGRFLNPAWLKPLMDHGYAGARTMGQEFLENLWGWQVTRPDLVKDWEVGSPFKQFARTVRDLAASTGNHQWLNVNATPIRPTARVLPSGPGTDRTSAE